MLKVKAREEKGVRKGVKRLTLVVSLKELPKYQETVLVIRIIIQIIIVKYIGGC